MAKIDGRAGSARLRDAGQIHEIIVFWSSKQKILHRAREEIESRIKDFVVFKDGKSVLGVISLFVYDKEFAELRSLSVRDGFGRNGIGKRLVAAAVEKAESIGIKKLFVLTSIPEFFSRFGFTPDKKVNDKKIWKDCANCPKRGKCDETYMELDLD
ncbi:MAG: GNAT family N-acetyltransferase [Candidatus Aenigmatarchaeota archaeon]